MTGRSTWNSLVSMVSPGGDDGGDDGGEQRSVSLSVSFKIINVDPLKNCGGVGGGL